MKVSKTEADSDFLLYKVFVHLLNNGLLSRCLFLSMLIYTNRATLHIRDPSSSTPVTIRATRLVYDCAGGVDGRIAVAEAAEMYLNSKNNLKVVNYVSFQLTSSVLYTIDIKCYTDGEPVPQSFLQS